MPRRRRASTRLQIVAAVFVVALVAGGLLIWAATRGGGGPPKATGKPCRVRDYGLDLEQARNATTIAAVGKRLGMPDHAVSIALATAYLESGLHNIDYGDRDSLGLFQQRPSQGWGTPAQIMMPHYAAANFYRHLARVPGWEVIPVTEAAQRVQRSALPDGYAQFEPAARAIAEALTGEVPAGFTCRVSFPPGAPPAGLQQAMTTELGLASLSAPLPAAQGWTVSSWLIGHAATFKIASVSFGGQTWMASRGTWAPDPAAGDIVGLTVSATGVRS
ncbi:MAG: hypothetical protein JO148_12640 [Acidimicrobiia bacterium]|nr:hypothetical protein [Acidimicrobiia bacterium]